MKNDMIINNLVSSMNARDTEAFLANFSADAHVIDSGEDKDISGLAEIGDWFEDFNSRFTFETRVLESADTANGFQFLALATGNFPGSPIRFSYKGIMLGQKIRELDIAVVK